jgi:diaminopimelate epimerase
MNIKLKFSKMHGLGNDYVMINEYTEEIIPNDKKPSLAKKLCRRGFSVGADGVIFVTPATLSGADVRFRIFNADGSEAEMCGNGIRCFAKFVYENSIISGKKLRVETLGGIKDVQLMLEKGKVTYIKVDMGIATFQTKEVPMKSNWKYFIDKELLVDEKPINMTVLSIGNPHAVIFTTNLSSIVLDDIGPSIENHESFTERINVHFVNIIDKNEIEMITWERGSGATLACGTGATSTVLAGYRRGILEKQVLVHLPGGELHVTVYQENEELGAFLIGNAELVFTGEMKINV